MKKLSNFMSFANDSNLKTVNSGHFQALVRKVKEVKEIKQSARTDKKMSGSDPG